ncbi:MAG: hypothetical protein IK990_14915 [Ruminiclostridium sp.]|nr:hypothetical protein [Ruminiclostridium sp.]
MRSFGLHRSSISRYMGRSSFKRSSVGRRNTYKVGSSTFKSYLAEARKIADDIEAAKSENTSETSRTKAAAYSHSLTGSKYNNGVTAMSDSVKDINDRLDADIPDMEKAYEAAVRFADGYNDMLAAVKSSSNSSVIGKARYISDVANVFSRALGKIGISTDKNGNLSVDKDKFMKADNDDISKIFVTKSSFASLIKEQTDSISVLSAMSADTYSGTHTAAYTSAMSGSIFSKLL